MKCIICHYGNIMKLLQIFHLFLLYLHSAVRWECVFVKVVVDTKWFFSKEVVYKVELTVSVRWMDMESTFSTRWTRKIAFYAQHSVQATNFQLQSCSEEVIMHRTKLATGRVNDMYLRYAKGYGHSHTIVGIAVLPKNSPPLIIHEWVEEASFLNTYIPIFRLEKKVSHKRKLQNFPYLPLSCNYLFLANFKNHTSHCMTSVFSH